MINKQELIKSVDTVFNNDAHSKILDNVKNTISEFSMTEHIKRGVLVGLSGGADSVLLLILLRFLKNEVDFPLIAVHINHSIRGDSADRDECFSKELCDALEISFESYKIDVPAIAKAEKLGIEEAARKVRYKIFDDVLSKHNDVSTIATAHNATDNLETLIFNLMRGTGISGLCGISPVRNNVIRPLINIPKSDITAILSENNIPFVTDETNFSTEYTRNYIRNEILPKLKKLNPIPEFAASKAIRNIRADANYINSVADDFFKENFIGGKIKAKDIDELPDAIFYRIILRMTKTISDNMPEKIHIDTVKSLVSQGKAFRVDMPGGVSFLCNGEYCYVDKTEREAFSFDDSIELKDGINVFSNLGIAIAISDDKNEDFSSNVYNFSIQADLYSAIIVGRLYLRTRRAGDAYFYGGMTHKVKKLFNDKKIPLDEREKTPVICDDKGIVWIPGFGVRADAHNDHDNLTHKWIKLYKIVK